MRTDRLYPVDALRGAAMVWMTVFHFCFDLSNAGLIQANFYRDPVWTWQRTCILSLFLLCAGAGQAIAVAQGQSRQRFCRRWAQIAGCAFLVTLGSLLMFPKSFIYFGVLHAMAVMLLIVRLSAGCGRWLWPMGAAVLALKFVAPWALGEAWLPASLNDKTLNWLGLVSIKPVSEDFVPLVPWLALVWWGMALAQWWLARRRSATNVATSEPSGPVPGLRPLAFLGRWSLSYYMVHQPVLLAGLWLFQRL
jgi:uncharacterized membrane protein